MKKLYAVATALAATFATGCGYQIGGHGDLMPSSVKTIAIPAFGNVTTRYKLARLLPQDIGREFESRTRYRIVADPKQADAVLTGTLAPSPRTQPYPIRSRAAPPRRRRW